MKTIERLNQGIRQGDVHVLAVSKTAGMREVEHDGVLALGEVTGHKHQLVGGKVRYFRDDRGDLFFQPIDRFVDLNHGSMPTVRSEGHFAHRFVNLGDDIVYRVGHQREADWLAEVNRDVAD